MIVVKVELWQGGDPNRVESLGVVMIANRGIIEQLEADGSPPAHDLRRYSVQLQEMEPGKPFPRLTDAIVTHWRRRGWVQLVAKAMNAVAH